MDEMKKEFDQIKYNETIIALWAFSTSCMLFLALIVLIIYSICGD